ncbi:MAG: hypothetical protein WBG94_20010, partial [Anaerolineales bacterium]
MAKATNRLSTILRNETPPNKMCSGRVGFVASFKHFSGFEFFLLPSIAHTRPPAGNAHLWSVKSKRGYNEVRTTIAKLRIGLLNKKRGNYAIQEKLIGADNVVDKTDAEVEHHEQVLTEAGYS